MVFLRQVLALVYKNILIAFVRRPITTFLRALVLPILIGWFFSYAQNFFAEPSLYGVGSPHDVRSLEDALAQTGSRTELIFVNNGFQGGQIEQIITEVGDIARNAGKKVQVIESEQELLTTCRNSLRGSSGCIAGVVFHSTPTEPSGQNLPYNYSLRYDGILGSTVFVNKDTNDQEIYLLPLQKAIDQAIANANGSLSVNAVDVLQEFPYTTETEDQRTTGVRLRYMRAIINFLGVAFFIGMCGVQYQQVGMQATERENRIAQLLEVMMPNKRRWQPQIARLLSYHISFTLLYLPGWLIMAIILKVAVFQRTSYGILIGLHLLTGLSLASCSLFVGAFFKRAQLSGITAVLISCVLAIISQVTPLKNGAVYALGILFPSANYVFSIIFMARFERRNRAANLALPAPRTTITVRGMIFWIFLAIQIVVFPLLAVIVERCLWGTASAKRHLHNNKESPAVAVRQFSKHFRPNWFMRAFGCFSSKKTRETVRAVDDLSFTVRQGQIMVMLGANGSGKSTTLDAIAGLSKPTQGDIELNFDHGIGFCPQQNVLWKDLTVYEHVQIFDWLKSIGTRGNKKERISLIKDCDLNSKVNAKAGSLSGGQMRKLQLAVMFIGDSGICLVDECSSGIDPLARKKIQDILLTERSRSQRTIIFTSHYLDEADIADYIIIMSKGKLKVQGSAPEIKHSGQYRIHVYHSPGQAHLPSMEDVPREEMYDQTIYTVNNATAASKVLTAIEAKGFRDYSVNGPTVEDVFMKVAEEMVPPQNRISSPVTTVEATMGREKGVKGASNVAYETSGDHTSNDLKLHAGTYIGPFRQAMVLFWKRYRVFLRAVYPNLAALIIIPVAMGLVSRFLIGFQRASCVPEDSNYLQDASLTLATVLGAGANGLVLGPQSAWDASAVRLIVDSLPADARNLVGPLSGSFLNGATFVESSEALYDYISNHTQSVFPGGIFLGATNDPPTIGYLAQPGDISYPAFMQNVISTIKYNNPISLSYQPFAIPWQAGQGNTLQYTIYLELVMAVVPAFFALYPTMERLRKVRSLHYSNGVRALPLWLSYTLFDFTFILVAATVSIAILVAKFDAILYGPGYFWLVMVLFGLCALLCSYVISLFARSQLGAFAIAAAYQAACALLWLIAYLSLITYGDPNHIDRNLNYAHFTMSLIMPTGSLFKALFVSLNVLSVNCRGSDQYVGSPGDITAYGGPILYLIVQSVLLFILLVWWDSGNKFGSLFQKKHRVQDREEKKPLEPEVIEEVERVHSSTDDSLRVLHLSKAYGKNLAVDDASFGVKRGEVFGLLGPNGAGKSTTMSAIRGDIKANSGEIYIENLLLTKKRALARQYLSACPQFDAMDRLTATEHLRFYAKIRGVKDVKHNINEVIRAVGLTKFENRMAEKLSGGNKRKLSLGIALMGNPSVMLLDEPSSGMDVAAKRVMWRTLESVVGGRSIVLTTHSMEEADRLCHRAGILAKQILTVGTTDDLKRKHGDSYYVHLLLKSAPYTTPDEESRAKSWIEKTFAGADVDSKSHHGQIRFSVPIHGTADTPSTRSSNETRVDNDEDVISKAPGVTVTPSGIRIASLFSTLENNKENMGFEYYSVGHATLDQVFLRIVTKHNVEEENSGLHAETETSRRGIQGWQRRLGL